MTQRTTNNTKNERCLDDKHLIERFVIAQPKHLLELFAGRQSISSAARELNIKTFTSDVDEKFKTDYTIDILDFDVKKVPFIPDIIWASPVCTTYSLAAISHHRRKLMPKSKLAMLSDRYIKKTQEIIRHFLDLNDDLIFYIENPRATLRKMPFMSVGEMFSENIIDIPFRTTVTYCQYADRAMKPTDIWHNNPKWKPRPMCKRGDNCHEPAPRGSKTGTQGKKNAEERSLVPRSLANEILRAAL